MIISELVNLIESKSNREYISIKLNDLIDEYNTINEQYNIKIIKIFEASGIKYKVNEDNSLRYWIN